MLAISVELFHVLVVSSICGSYRRSYRHIVDLLVEIFVDDERDFGAGVNYSS